jgi:hypothetical protein
MGAMTDAKFWKTKSVNNPHSAELNENIRLVTSLISQAAERRVNETCIMRCKACLRAQRRHFEHLMCLSITAINLTSRADDRYSQYADNDGNNGFQFLGYLPGFNKESSDRLTQHHITKTMSKGVLCHQYFPSILALWMQILRNLMS